MANSVVILSSVAAQNVDSFNKTGVHATVAQQNGFIVVLGAKSTTAGQKDAYVTTTPGTSGLATDDFYMVYSAPIPTVSGWKGLTDDPRLFSVPATEVFSMFKPQPGDEVIITTDGLAGSKTAGTPVVVPANGVGNLTWAANTTGVALGFAYEGDTFVSIGNERVTAYKFRCILS